MKSPAIMVPFPESNILISRIGNGANKYDMSLFKNLPSGFNFRYPEEASSAIVFGFDLVLPASIMDIVTFIGRPIDEISIYWGQLFKAGRTYYTPSADKAVLASGGRPNLFFLSDDKMIVPVFLYELAGQLSLKLPDMRSLNKYSSNSGMRIFIRQPSQPSQK